MFSIICSSKIIGGDAVLNSRKPIFSIVLNTFIVILILQASIECQTAAFSYQGRLTDGGNPANGAYQMQFKLFDSLAAGTQIGSTINDLPVTVTQGVFSVKLDFGANALNGANCWLEIAVRPVGSEFYTTLSPREQIASSPYAIRTLSAASADALSSACLGCVQDANINTVAGTKVTGTVANAANAANATLAATATNAMNLGGVAADQFVQTSDTRLTDARNPLPNSANYIQNAVSLQAGSNFNISGNGSAGGTLAGNIIRATTQFNIGPDRILWHPGDNVFAGRSAGAANSIGGFNAFFGSKSGLANTSGDANVFVGASAGELNNTGDNNTFVGTNAGFPNTSGSGNSFFGRNAGLSSATGEFNTGIGYGADLTVDGISNATAVGARAAVGASNSIVLGSINGVNGATASTNVGIGTTTPAATLGVVSSTAGVADNTAYFVAPNIGSNASHIHYGTTGDWYIRSAAAGGKVVIQDLGGNVGIGTTSPDQKLTVNGNASKPGGGSWATFSDNRLKTIKGAYKLGLNALMQLRPVRYFYKPNNPLGLHAEGEHIGFNAQALEKVIPAAVSRNEEGYLMVNNDPIIWTMLNAIQEQQSLIDQLTRILCNENRRAPVCRKQRLVR